MNRHNMDKENRSDFHGEMDHGRSNNNSFEENRIYDHTDDIQKEFIRKEKNTFRWIIICIVLAVGLFGALTADYVFHKITEIGPKAGKSGTQVEEQENGQSEEKTVNSSASDEFEISPSKEDEQSAGTATAEKDTIISWDESWQYANNSKIHSSDVILYRAQRTRRNITVALNAGHGTSGGSSVKTQCHPDGSPKVTGGSTAVGETMAAAVSEGTSMLDGSTEKSATLELALLMKEDLLSAGYDVLMIRESEDVQLDNIGRTVIANNNADCHIALHYDSTDSDKGLFYIDVPNVASYRSMEPVASHWQEHHALGEAVLLGMRHNNVKIYGSGSMAIDLTQTSYSTIPSIDLEVGDRASDLSKSTLSVLSEGLLDGLDQFFGE